MQDSKDILCGVKALHGKYLNKLSGLEPKD